VDPREGRSARGQVDAHTCLGAKRLSTTAPRSAGKEAKLLTRRRQSKHPPAPQEKSFALTSPEGQESFRFCPRVFPQNRHFSQKSAPQTAKIRALLWAYRGPRERKDAGKSHVSPQMPTPEKIILSSIHTYMSTHLCSSNPICI
jgi:hypothetical protein